MNKHPKKVDWSVYTPFQQSVLKLICKIPEGQVWTYKQVAVRLGKPNAARAVGNALKINKNAPYVPCHRVVAQNGLGGYSAAGGLAAKKRLLKKEGYLK